MKRDPIEGLLQTARASFHTLSGGAHLPQRAVERLAENFKSAPLDPKTKLRMRYIIDVLAAIHRHSDLRTHASTHQLLARQLGHDDQLMLEAEHGLMDAQEVARCIALMGEGMSGINGNVADGLKGESVEPTEARQAALDLLREMSDGLPGALAKRASDQKVYARVARKLVTNFAKAGGVHVQSASMPRGNPLIARKQGRSDTTLILDLYRDMWMGSLPKTAGGKPKDKSRLQRDFEKALGMPSLQELEVGRFVFNDPDIGTFNFEFCRARDLGQPEPEKEKECKKLLAEARRSMGVSARKLEMALKWHCLENIREARIYDMDDGHLNAAGFARLVANPNATGQYYQNVMDLDTRATVTLLQDNSLSMRNHNKYISATAAMRRLGDAHYRAGVNFEVLGYTHSADYQATRFIVYKDYNLPWAMERNFMHYNLQEDHYRGTPEGSAVFLAYKRLLMRPERNKILIVINDGEPNDENMLRRVMELIKKDGLVRVACVALRDKQMALYEAKLEKLYQGRVIACEDPLKLSDAVSLGIAELLFPAKAGVVFPLKVKKTPPQAAFKNLATI